MGLPESCADLVPGAPGPSVSRGAAPGVRAGTPAHGAPRSLANRSRSPSRCLQSSHFFQIKKSLSFWQKTNVGRQEEKHLPNQTHAKLSMCR